MSLPGMTVGEMKRKEFRMPEVLLDPWLRVGDRMMLHAADGLGKSWLAMAVAMAVAGGGRVMDWQAQRPAQVLFIDAELSNAELDYRRAALRESLEGVDDDALDENLRIVSQVDFDADAGEWPTPEGGPDELTRWAEVHGANLVVMDNLFGLSDVTDANQAAQWRPLNQLTRRLKGMHCATLMVHHDNKEGHGYSGSADLSRELDVRLHIQARAVQVPGEAAFRLTCRKDRHGQHKGWSAAVAMRGDLKEGERLRWVMDAEDEEPKASAKVSLDDQCRNLMVQARADYWPSKTAFLGDYGGSMPTLNGHIRDAVRLGYVESWAAFTKLMKERPAVDCGEPEF